MVNNKPAENILCVDDEANVLHMFRRTLGRRFNITTAASAIEALSILERQPEFAIILSDYNMPDMNGVEFLKRAKALAPDSIQIMLTGNIELNIAINAINETDIFRYLPKPCPSDVLIKVLNDALEQYQLFKEKIRLGNELAQKNRALELSNDELAKQKYLLQYELEMARIIFANVNRYSNPTLSGLDYLAHAKQTVGGDFMLNHCSRDHQVHYLLIGDLTGHGLQSALAVLLVTEIFEVLSNQEPDIEILAQGINDKMCRKLPTGLFCAAILLRLDLSNRELQIWQGGMPNAYILDQQGQVVTTIKSSNLPLGVSTDRSLPCMIDRHSLNDPKIESLFVYSDGVSEQIGDDASAFGEQGIRSALLTTPSNQRRIDYVLEQLRQFQHDQPQNDDISLFELHFKQLANGMETTCSI